MLNTTEHEFNIFLQRLSVMENEASERIQSKLEILYKYRVVRRLRTKQLQLLLPDVDLKTFSSAEIFIKIPREKLLALPQWDDAVKQAVFSQKFALLSEEHKDKLVSVLTPIVLNTLLTAVTSQDVINILEKAGDDFFKELTLWRKTLDNFIKKSSQQLSWRQWVWEQSYAVIKSAYQFSFLGLGTQVGQMAGEVMMGYPRTGQCVGGGVGLAFSYTMGSYGIVKSILLGSASAKIIKVVSRQLLNERQASYYSPTVLLHPSFIPYEVNLLVSGVEFLYLRQVTPILRSLAISLTSGLSLLLFNMLKFDLNDPEQRAKANLSRVTAVLFGTQLGAALFQLLDNAYTNVMVNRKFFETLQHYLGAYIQKSSLTVDSPNMWSASFWFSQQQTVRASWQFNNNPFFVQHSCELQANPINHYIAANCSRNSIEFLALA